MTDDELQKSIKENEDDGSPGHGGNTETNGDKDGETPSRNTSSGNGASGKAGAAAQTGNSKAATVEHACKYIKYLQRENERLVAELQRLKLAAGSDVGVLQQSAGISSGSSPSSVEIQVKQEEQTSMDRMMISDEVL